MTRSSTPRRVQLGDHETVVVDSGGSDVPLVLVHGVSFDWRMWTLVLDRLPESVRTLAYDLRGHGAAKAAPGRPTPPVLAADLAALLDVLEIEGARIAGLSYGGTVAQEFALAYPHRVVALALVSTRASPFPPFSAGADAAERDGIETQAEGALERWFGPEVVAEGGWPVEYARTCLRTIPLATWTVALRAIAAFDVLDRLDEISVPTQVVAAELDTVGRPEHMREIATSIPGARFDVFDGAHHLLCFLRPEGLAGLLAT
jgi:3-oxoadipate enol-lactonase